MFRPPRLPTDVPRPSHNDQSEPRVLHTTNYDDTHTPSEGEGDEDDDALVLMGREFDP